MPIGNAKLQGVLSVFQTPYRDDETIDAATLQKHIGWIYDCGADGVVMAMVSEVLRLSSEERRELAELACRFGSERGAVVISVGAESAKLAEEYTRHAGGCGAAGVMAIPPVCVAVGDAELMRYYERIIRASNLPVVVQDASGYVGRPMSIALQAQLMKEFGAERVLFKPEATPIGPRLSELRDGTNGQAKIFEGTGGIALVDSYRRGIVGTMPGGDLVWALVALWRALKAGDEQRIYQLSSPISSLIAVQNSLDAFLAVEKYLLVKQGIFKNTLVRGPVGYTLDEETRREIDRLFDLLKRAVETKQMIIDVHSHTWQYPAHFGEDFRRQAARARAGAEVDLTVRYEDYRATCPSDTRTIVFGGKAKLSDIWVDDRYVADYVAKHPDTLIGFLSLDPTRDGWEREMRQGCEELGLRGIKLMPMYAGFNPDDARLDALWRYAGEHKLPVLLHTGTTFVAQAPLDCTLPRRLDPVATRFPDVKIIMAHLGHPYEGECVAVFRKHPNVFADISALHYRPFQLYHSLMLVQEYGVWNKVLFGTDYPFTTVNDTLAGVRKLNGMLDGTKLPRLNEAEIEKMINRDGLTILGLQ